MLNHLFRLCHGSDSSLQQQLREQISAAIMAGHIAVDLPLERRLALLRRSLRGAPCRCPSAWTTS